MLNRDEKGSQVEEEHVDLLQPRMFSGWENSSHGVQTYFAGLVITTLTFNMPHVVQERHDQQSVSITDGLYSIRLCKKRKRVLIKEKRRGEVARCSRFDTFDVSANTSVV